MIKIVKAKKVKRNIKTGMSKLFADSFYDYFRSFNIGKIMLYKAFKNIFDLDKFYVVLLDGELIGMGACGNGDSTIKLSKRSLCFSCGFEKGKRLYDYLKIIFEERDYFFEIDKACGMLEFIAVNEAYRNRKVGFTLTNHIMYDNNYERYLAKVADNNYCARTVLENAGFEEFDTEQSKIKEKEDFGVDTYLYMICENPNLRSQKCK